MAGWLGGWVGGWVDKKCINILCIFSAVKNYGWLAGWLGGWLAGWVAGFGLKNPHHSWIYTYTINALCFDHLVVWSSFCQIYKLL